MKIAAEIFRGKRVFVTGHTGFKGSWLCEWLLLLGAEVWGYSLPPPTTPALFQQLQLGKRIHRHETGDIRDEQELARAVRESRPDFVFHLAAQPLVRASYEQPVETYATNVMGTVHLLEALRHLPEPCVAVIVTTDKCYENRERFHSYVEDDPLGGHDPYSSSKGAAEIAVSSFRRSFFSAAGAGRERRSAVASVRSGNVIGGGDWARDRIVPDCMRSLRRGEKIGVRNPGATRPWQHVLEPLAGYLTLAAQLRLALAGDDLGRLEALSSAFNFGPVAGSNRTVRDVVEEILRHWPGAWEDTSRADAVHEANLLDLSIAKAGRLLGWQPRWDFAETIRQTVEWYRKVPPAAEGEAAVACTQGQIRAYQA